MNLRRLTDTKALPWMAAALAALLALLLAGGGGEGTAGSQEERRIAEVLGAIAGAGKVEVALFYGGETDGPTGAVVVAQGADDPLVRMQLEQALCALLGLPNSAVSVVTGGK